jgi:hypothetical protein
MFVLKVDPADVAVANRRTRRTTVRWSPFPPHFRLSVANLAKAALPPIIHTMSNC